MNECIHVYSVSLKFGSITCAAGVTGVCVGSLVATRLRRVTSKADPFVCAFGLFTCGPFFFFSLFLSRYNIAVTWVSLSCRSEVKRTIYFMIYLTIIVTTLTLSYDNNKVNLVLDKIFRVPPIISGMGKARNVKFGRCIHRVPANTSPLKIWEKTERWHIQGVPKFFEYPLLSGTGKATNFKFGCDIHRVHPNKSP